MKTLRSERDGLLPEPRTASGRNVRNELFFSEYGDYRVVEGVLYVDEHGDSGKTYTYMKLDGGGYVDIGDSGVHIKFILPPEEEPAGLAAEMLEVSRAQTDAARGREAEERARANRYEEALREIAGTCWPHLVPTDRVALLRSMAKGALEDE